MRNLCLEMYIKYNRPAFIFIYRTIRIQNYHAFKLGSTHITISDLNASYVHAEL